MLLNKEMEDFGVLNVFIGDKKYVYEVEKHKTYIPDELIAFINASIKRIFKNEDNLDMYNVPKVCVALHNFIYDNYTDNKHDLLYTITSLESVIYKLSVNPYSIGMETTGSDIERLMSDLNEAIDQKYVVGKLMADDITRLLHNTDSRIYYLRNMPGSRYSVSTYYDYNKGEYVPSYKELTPILDKLGYNTEIVAILELNDIIYDSSRSLYVPLTKVDVINLYLMLKRIRPSYSPDIAKIILNLIKNKDFIANLDPSKDILSYTDTLSIMCLYDGEGNWFRKDRLDETYLKLYAAKIIDEYVENILK